MDAAKDYYGILGVLPDAEEIVVRAAYRALAQRYHPDRSPRASADEANARMAEINEAYVVLADHRLRETYDEQRRARGSAGNALADEVEEPPGAADDPVAADWRIATRYYPDLAAHEARLARFSWKLASSYRIYLLETRQFEPRAALAAMLEERFLHTYFGGLPRNLEFARRLILDGRRAAARALNEAIRVLGADADPTRVIPRIAQDFDVAHLCLDLPEQASPQK